jgi:hypothetical protein
MKFEVLTTVVMKIPVFLYVTPHVLLYIGTSLVKVKTLCDHMNNCQSM